MEMSKKCAKCGATDTPMFFVEPVPCWSLALDEEDKDYKPGAEVAASGEVRVGLEVCRQCQEIMGVWLESSTAPFYDGWGERRPEV